MENPNEIQNIFHEIQNYVSVIGSSLQLIEKQHPEVNDFQYWSETRNDLNALTKLVLEASYKINGNN